MCSSALWACCRHVQAGAPGRARTCHGDASVHGEVDVPLLRQVAALGQAQACRARKGARHPLVRYDLGCASAAKAGRVGSPTMIRRLHAPHIIRRRTCVAEHADLVQHKAPVPGHPPLLSAQGRERKHVHACLAGWRCRQSRRGGGGLALGSKPAVVIASSTATADVFLASYYTHSAHTTALRLRNVLPALFVPASHCTEPAAWL